MLGLALLLFGMVIVWTARIPKPIGYLMGTSGVAFVVVGWLVGSRGFTSANALPTNAGYTLLFAAASWLLVDSWRRTSPAFAGVTSARVTTEAVGSTR